MICNILHILFMDTYLFVYLFIINNKYSRKSTNVYKAEVLSCPCCDNPVVSPAPGTFLVTLAGLCRPGSHHC